MIKHSCLIYISVLSHHFNISCLHLLFHLELSMYFITIHLENWCHQLLCRNTLLTWGLLLAM